MVLFCGKFQISLISATVFIYLNLKTVCVFRNALRTTEMADLLTFLGQLQTRFAPFLANYHNFMQQDPEIPPDVSLN